MTEIKTTKELFSHIRLNWNPNFRDPSKDYHLADQKKKDAIEHLEKRFTRDLNNKSRYSSSNEDFWKDQRFYMQPVRLQPAHLNYALENKKAFIKWFLTKYPKYNIPYDPKKRNVWTHIKYGRKQDAKFVKINPYYAARQRDLLFGTNGVEAVTAENWWQKIRDAKDEQEIKDIKLLLDSEWEIDNFVDTVETLIYVINDDLWDLNWWVNGVEKRPEGEWYLNREKHKDYFEGKKKYFSPTFFGPALRNVARHFYNQQFKERFARGGSESAWGSAGTGSVNALIQLQQEAGMDFVHFVAYDLTKEELERVKDKALFKAQECEKAYLWEKIWKLKLSRLRGGKDWVTPDLVSWSPDSPPKQAPDKPSSVNPELGQEQELPDKLKVSKADQEKQVKDKLGEIKDKLKDPNKNQTLNKKEARNKISDLGVELTELEKNGGDSKMIGDLTKQIAELRQQLEEVKQSLKGMLAEAKDYAQKLFNWFKTKNAKQLTFQDNGEILVECNDGKKETLASSEVKNNEVLSQFKEYCQQSQQNSLSFSELSQISGSSPSPNNETTNKKHWDEYGKYYIGAGVVLILISVGAAIYHFWIKKQEK